MCLPGGFSKGKTMSHIFVSYKREDSEFVLKEVIRLQRTYRVWWDKTSIVGGEDWEKAIRAGLEDSVALLVVLSPKAVESPYVRFEYETALDSGIPVIPVMIEPCDIPVRLRKVQVIKTADAAWYEELTTALQNGVPNIDTAELLDGHARIESVIGDPNLTFEEAAAKFKGTLRFDRHELNLVALPMLVTQYAMTYLVGQAGDTLKRSPEIQVALQMSQGYNSPNFPVQVAKYIHSREELRLHMILVRGPMGLTKHQQHGISMVHELDNSNENEWRGVVNATYTSIERYHNDTDRPQMLHVFNIAPAALVGAIGLRAERGMGMTLYNFIGAGNYYPVYSKPAQ